MVLLQITERLSRYVSNLTVQVIKDDWQQSLSHPSMLRSTSYDNKSMLENYNFSSFTNDSVYYTPNKERPSMLSTSTPLAFQLRNY